jgi:hypothetical protein
MPMASQESDRPRGGLSTTQRRRAMARAQQPLGRSRKRMCGDDIETRRKERDGRRGPAVGNTDVVGRVAAAQGRRKRARGGGGNGRAGAAETGAWPFFFRNRVLVVPERIA